MRNDPTLAVTTYRTQPRSTFGRGVTMTVRAVGGLNYLRGNAKPYFSLTKEEHRKGLPNQCWSGGCDHETILKYWPKFADLAALHLSDIDGIPMHAESNGWYNLAATLPGQAGEDYTSATSQHHFKKPADAPRRGEWDDTDYRNPTAEESLEFFANGVRIDMDTARQVQAEVLRVWHLTRVGCT